MVPESPELAFWVLSPVEFLVGGFWSLTYLPVEDLSVPLASAKLRELIFFSLLPPPL